MWDVRDHPDATAEYEALSARERVAVDNAIVKLKATGSALGYPHSSNVKGANKLRELRPRGGRSVTRPFYRQFGNVFVIGAYGPEAESDPKGFKRACKLAEARLNTIT